MAQLSLFQQTPVTFSVSEINAYLRQLMEADEVLQDVWVQGEISNLSRPKSGHLYFTIKDPNAALRGVMWRGQAARLAYQPQDGDAVEVHGGISVYEAGGQYQLYADTIRPVGVGSLYEDFNRLKEKLEAEGLFDPERKRAILARPVVIGIVTSPTGAALRDMLNTLRRRYPLAAVVLAPASVQGEAAPAEIVAALKGLNETVKPDVILVARGGGSIEDLWAFNDERVARAIAASAAPVISGVGHETDFTIADFVADLRAPTPTAAAELAAPDQIELRGILLERLDTLAQGISGRLNDRRWALKELSGRLVRSSPEGRLRGDRQRLDENARRAETAIAHRVEVQRARLDGLGQSLTALSPEAVLERGYALVTKDDGVVVKQVGQLQAGEDIRVRVSDGEFGAEVTEK